MTWIRIQRWRLAVAGNSLASTQKWVCPRFQRRSRNRRTGRPGGRGWPRPPRRVPSRVRAARAPGWLGPRSRPRPALSDGPFCPRAGTFVTHTGLRVLSGSQPLVEMAPPALTGSLLAAQSQERRPRASFQGAAEGGPGRRTDVPLFRLLGAAGAGSQLPPTLPFITLIYTNTNVHLVQ